MEDWEDIGSFRFHCGLYQDNFADEGVHLAKDEETQQKRRHKQQQQQPPPIVNSTSPDPQLIRETAKLGIFQTGISVPNSETNKEHILASLELFSNYASDFKTLKGERLSNVSGRKLSTEEIMKFAGERYIQFSTQGLDDIYMLMHPFGTGSTLAGLSIEETQDVELAHLLLAAAEKVGYQQFKRASKLLSRCEWLASDTGNPVQRIAFYFGKALLERIDRETGDQFPSKTMGGKGKGKYNMTDPALNSNLAFLACHQQIPFNQVVQFAGIQAILENMAFETKIHLVDFNIRSGVQWIVLMQALTQQRVYPIRYLKITAVGTAHRQMIEETGKRLISFAESLKLPFKFEVIFLSDMKDLKEELFDIEPGEALAIYSPMVLRTMVSRPNCLETLMKLLRKLGPSIVVLTEVEANHNSPSFVNRFIEALFFHSAFFDCLDDCMDRNNQYRMIIEGMFFHFGIHNIVASEGKERITRSVKIDVWRAFFARFGLVEVELSESTLYQANLVVQQFPCGSSCNLEINGKCLIAGWKGTPIHSVSAWKFC